MKDAALLLAEEEHLPLGNRSNGKEAKRSSVGGDFPNTDLGNAERLVKRHGDDLRYCFQTGKWFCFSGRRWERDETGEVARRAKETARSILHEAGDEVDDNRRKALLEHARRSEQEPRIRAMITLAQSEGAVPVRLEELDPDPLVLNCHNGTVDLETGKLHEHWRMNLITKLCPVYYDPEATLSEWDTFLEQATGGDKELQAFLQRAAGYSLTGRADEEVLFFVHGPSATGKSTFLESLKAALGDYAVTADFDAFLKRRDAGGPRSDIARLAGARFVVSIEVDEGKRLAEGLIKGLTGGDTVTARHLYQTAFEFRPTFKLWLAANHCPRVSSEDAALWRRILRVPFEHVVPKENRDPRLKALLRDPKRAGPAILAWAVRGCLAWQQHGLGVPPLVDTATASLRKTMDPLVPFLEQCCIEKPGLFVSAEALRKAYEQWARESGEHFLVRGRAWGEGLKSRGYSDARRYVGRERVRGWLGVGLLGADEQLELGTDSDVWDTKDGQSHNFEDDFSHEEKLCKSPSQSVPRVESVPSPGDLCSICGAAVFRFGADGVGYCELHSTVGIK